MVSQQLYSLEKDISNLLLDKLEHLQITTARAAEIARFVLSALPDNLTDEQVRKIIPSLDDKFFELTGVVHQHLYQYEETDKEQVANKVQILMKKGAIEQARILMTNYFNSKKYG